MKNDVVMTRFLFGRSKAGIEFKGDREMDDYVCYDIGNAIQFSQNRVQRSPYIKRFGAIKRDNCWNKPV